MALSTPNDKVWGGLTPAVWLAWAGFLVFCFESMMLLLVPPPPNCAALPRLDARLVKATVIRRNGTDEVDVVIATGSGTLTLYARDVSPERDRIRAMAAGAAVSVSYLPAPSTKRLIQGQLWGLTADGIVVLSCAERGRRAEFSRLLSKVLSAAAVLLFIAASIYGWRRIPRPHL